MRKDEQMNDDTGKNGKDLGNSTESYKGETRNE